MMKKYKDVRTGSVYYNKVTKKYYCIKDRDSRETFWIDVLSFDYKHGPTLEENILWVGFGHLDYYNIKDLGVKIDNNIREITWFGIKTLFYLVVSEIYQVIHHKKKKR